MPTPGGPTKQSMEPLRILHELANGEKFENALFDLLEAVVLVIENFFGGLNIANFLGALFPGHGQEPVDIIAADGGFRGHRRHEFQALQFRSGLFQHILGHAGGIDLFLQILDFVLFAAAEFFLDRLEFFVEVILFLRPFHLALDAGVDVAINVELFQFNFENIGDAVEALERIGSFE